MLIEQVAGALGALLLKNTFGFRLAESRTIGLGLLGGQLSFSAFSKSLQVN